MSNQDNQLNSYLSQLGLNTDEVKVFISLVKHGESTTLEISRNTGISRTQSYRIIEQMKDKGYVEEIIDKYTTRARAISFEKLELLVNYQYQKAEELKNRFSDIKTILSGFIGINQKETKVLFYRGLEGLKQLVWNDLRAKEEIRGYTYRWFESFVGEEFAKKWYQEAIRRGIKMRDIYSDEYVSSVKGKKRLIDLPEFNKFQCQSKYISPKILQIDHQIDIYNDVVAYHNWYQGEVFGIEIYNKKISRMQKQIFDILWKNAKKEPNMQ